MNSDHEESHPGDGWHFKNGLWHSKDGTRTLTPWFPREGNSVFEFDLSSVEPKEDGMRVKLKGSGSTPRHVRLRFLERERRHQKGTDEEIKA